MRTTDVANAYNIRRRYFSSEYNIGNKITRGKITRSILNTDLSALTYEHVIKLSKKFDNFDNLKLTKTQQKSIEINEWILNVSENTKWISSLRNPSRLPVLQSELQSVQVTGLQPKELFKSFYNTYIKVILVVLEDALIRIYLVEDTKSLSEEIDSMLSNLIELNPIGGLASNIQILSDISSGRPKSSEDDPHVEFIDTYAHISFVWSQSAQLISDYINSIESSEPISLEKANQSLQQRMEQVAKKYKTF